MNCLVCYSSEQNRLQISISWFDPRARTIKYKFILGTYKPGVKSGVSSNCQLGEHIINICRRSYARSLFGCIEANIPSDDEREE